MLLCSISPLKGLDQTPYVEIPLNVNVTAEELAQTWQEGKKAGERIVQEVLAIPDVERTFANTVEPFDEIDEILHRTVGFPSFFSHVSPDQAVREMAMKIRQEGQIFDTEIYTTEALYQALKKIDLDRATLNENLAVREEQKRFYTETLLEYKRNGMELNLAARERLKALKAEITNLSMQFSQNIQEYVDTLEVSQEELAGLPETYLQGLVKNTNGFYAIGLDYPSFLPFMKFAQSEKARRALHFKFFNRATEKNLPVLRSLIAKRHELATLLGYKTFADYQLELRMAQNPTTVWKFLYELHGKLGKKAQAEYGTLLRLKNEITGQKATEVYGWERAYYTNLLEQREYQLDQARLTEYFPLPRVVEGVMGVTQKLYGVHLIKVENAVVWAEGVELYKVCDGERVIGRLYLDLFPRPNKYSHAAQFGLIPGRRLKNGSYQSPVVALVCNFPKPKASMPSLLSHSTVITFFHEFGHAMHSFLSQTHYASYAGTKVLRDFVEAPSQMFEEWVWNKEVLASFARHYKTGEPIPDELLTALLKSRSLNTALDYQSKVFASVIDMEYHTRGPIEDTTAIWAKVQNELSLFPYTPGTHFEAAFGHLTGYAAGYYSYLWSEVYAKDMFTCFAEKGLLNPEMGARFKSLVLSRGGSRDPNDLIRDFLGREPNQRAFLKSLGIE